MRGVNGDRPGSHACAAPIVQWFVYEEKPEQRVTSPSCITILWTGTLAQNDGYASTARRISISDNPHLTIGNG